MWTSVCVGTGSGVRVRTHCTHRGWSATWRIARQISHVPVDLALRVESSFLVLADPAGHGGLDRGARERARDSERGHSNRASREATVRSKRAPCAWSVRGRMLTLLACESFKCFPVFSALISEWISGWPRAGHRTHTRASPRHVAFLSCDSAPRATSLELRFSRGDLRKRRPLRTGRFR